MNFDSFTARLDDYPPEEEPHLKAFFELFKTEGKAAVLKVASEVLDRAPGGPEEGAAYNVMSNL